MPKQLKVSLDFTANTDQAKKQIQDLSTALQKISVKTPSIVDDQQLKKAAAAASELQKYLSAAVNVDTGKINLAEFSRQLTKGNTDLSKLHRELTAIGPDGVTAFNQLSRSLLQAETNTSKLKTMMSGFLTTLKNTARWQISSSILHGITGAIQSAWYYAQDLDESLNNIRIVTGQNADQMAQFAKEANVAAQALKTTTTAYTNASLIYYQQGLSDKEVKDRTDITVKMANVTGESAQTISEQMTAVWNNFYDGSQSLESFSDKMVALGAATASSSSEISAGLNQFAATANTVGLSFDYAAAALATVTATTRQSANVVGNSFKTLFARLEGLSLGETLEDGTNLNKYSAALEKVGISIKDQNGELKAMDTILDELGSRWQTLAKDQQVALAQTVGGVRQYTQLIALMDNWDFMQENLQTVSGSKGALQTQQNIYAEGWRAARDEAKAALEGIYDTLIDDKKLKKLYSASTVILNSINGIIKGLGGIPGILAQITSFILQIQAKNMPAYVNSIVDGFNKIAGKSREKQGSVFDQLQTVYSKQPVNIEENPQGAAEIYATQNLITLKNTLLKVQNELSDSERQQFEYQIHQIESTHELLTAQAGVIGKEKDRLVLLQRLAVTSAQNNAIKKKEEFNEKEAKQIEDLIQLYTELTQTKAASRLQADMAKEQADVWAKFEGGSKKEDVIAALDIYIDKLKELGAVAGRNSGNDGKHIGFEQFINQLQKFKEIAEPTEEDIKKIKASFIDLMQNTKLNSVISQNLESLGLDLKKIKEDLAAKGVPQTLIDKLGTDAKLTSEEINTLAERLNLTTEQVKKLQLTISKGHQKTFAEDVSKVASSLLAISAGINGLMNLVDVFSDKTSSFATKVSQGASGLLSLGMGIMRVIKMMQEMSRAMQITTGVIGGVLLVIQVVAKIIELVNAKRQAEIEQANKEAEKIRTLVKEHEELVSALQAEAQVYRETGNASSSYISQLEKLIDVYDLQDQRLSLLLGDYESVEQAIYDKIKAEKLEAANKANTAVETYEKNNKNTRVMGYQQAVKKEIQVEGETYTAYSKRGAEGLYSLTEGFDKDKFNQIFDRLVELNYLVVDAQENVESFGLANVDLSNVEEVYNLLLQLKDMGVSDFQSFNEKLSDLINGEGFQEYKTNLINRKKQAIGANFVNPNEIDSLDKFNEKVKELNKQYELNDILTEALSSNVSNIAKEYTSFNSAMKAAGITLKNNETEYDAALAHYQSLDETQKSVYLQLVLDKKSVKITDEEIKAFIEGHKTQTIEIKISLVEAAKEEYSEGMSGEQLQAWGEKYKSVLKDAGIQLEDFILMSEEAKAEFFNSAESALSVDKIQAMTSDLKYAREEFEKLKESNNSDAYLSNLLGDEGAATFKETLNKYQNAREGTHDKDAYAAQLQDYIDQYPQLIALTAQGEEQEAAFNAQLERQTELLNIEKAVYASKIDNIDDLNEALAKGNITAEQYTKQFAKLKEKLDDEIDAEDWEELADFLHDNQAELDGFTKSALVTERTFKRVSQAILRFDNAVKEISDHYDDWMDALESGNAQEAAEAAEQMRDTYADLLDLPFDTLSGSFLENAKNLELMKIAATGDEDAYRQLQDAVREDIVVHLSVDKVNWDTQYATLMDEYNRLNGLQDLEVGASIDDTAFINACNQMIAAAGMTADQATNFLASMGVDAELETHPTPIKRTSYEWVPPVYDVATTGPIGDSRGPGSDFGFPQIVKEGYYKPKTKTEIVNAVTIKTGSAKKTSGGNFKSNNSSAGGGGGSGGGGGGGGSQKTGQAEHAKKASPQKNEDRYHVINNQIEDLAKQYDRLSEAEERAFGKTKLDLMDKQKEKLDQQYKAQRQLREEAERYWKEDLENLQNAAFDSDGDDIPDTFGFNRYNNDDWYAKTHFDEEGNSLGPLGLDLDENGTILNHDALKEAAYDYYNQIALEYNKWLDDNYIGKEVDDALEEQKKQWDEKLKNEEQYRDNFLGLIKQYEDTQDKVQDELNKEIKAYHDELDQMLERTDYAVQVRLDVDDDSLALLNFLMNTLEDNPYRASEAITNLQKQFDVTQDKYAANKQGLRDLFNNHFSMDHVFDNSNADVGNNSFAAKMRELGYDSADALMEGLASGKTNVQQVLGSMGEEFSEEEIGKFREYSKGMMGSVEDMLAIRQNMYKTLDDYIAQSNDDLDRLRDKIDNLSKVTEHWKNIIDLVGRDVAGLDTDMMIENEEKSLNILQAKVAADKDLMDEADAVLKGLKLQQGQYEEGSNEWNEWKKRVEEAEDRLTEMTENYYSSWEEALEAVKTKFEKTMKWLGEDYSKTLGGKAGNLEGLQNLMDQYQKTHDTYVPEFERVYQLNKLNAAAVKAIDETNNIKAKKQLQEYQQQILEAQESGREMSEYELQNLEKELALRQAALALEESRNVKSQVRMQRDNEGNYSYVYTADEDAVADAENNYRDKLYEMQKANYEYINELQNNIVSLQQDYQQAIANAAETYGYGTEAYYDAVDKINSYYDEALKAQYNELNLAMKNNQDLQEFDKNFHAQMTHDKSVSDEGYITSFDQTLYSQLTGYQTLENATSAWSEASSTYTSGAEKAVKAYKDALEKTCNYAGTTLAGQSGDTGPYAAFGQKAKQAFTDARNAAVGEDGESGFMGDVEKMAKRAKEALVGEGDDYSGGLIGDVGAWVKATVGLINGTEEEAGGIVGALDNVIALLTGVETAIKALPDEKTVDIKVNVPEVKPIDVDINYNYNTNGSPPAEAGGGGGGSTGGSYQQEEEEPTYEQIPNNDAIHRVKWPDGKTTTEGHTYNSNDKCTKCGFVRKKITTLIGHEQEQQWFASGGYTGSWGNEGKLAVLHEKELVLNKEDTANMLAAVGMIRQISDVIDLNAKSSGGAFSSLFAANVRTGAQELQQDVHITAEFPNATDHNEILEAFDNVINLASQYANRKVQPAYTSF